MRGSGILFENGLKVGNGSAHALTHGACAANRFPADLDIAVYSILKFGNRVFFKNNVIHAPPTMGNRAIDADRIREELFPDSAINFWRNSWGPEIGAG